MNVEVDVSDVDKYKADGRGRVTLGAEYANSSVTVAVLEVEQNDG